MEDLDSQTILVIDDEPFALKWLAHQLSRLGMTEVILTQSANEALNHLADSQRKSPDLVICDLQMPGMDGVELVRHLGESGYTGGLVLVSGESHRILESVEALARAHRLQILGTLQKPVGIEALQQVLARYSAPAQRTQPRKTYSAAELEHAIQAGELINYYQPKVRVATAEVCGFEALVRWQHPQDGLIFPDQFIALAEAHGLIDQLTETVLRNALEQNSRWRRAGFDWQVAVNISMDNLSNLAFPDQVVGAVGRLGLPWSSLILEVTESRLMSNPSASLDILNRLRLKGIGLSIDDFGTGHSSLVQLRDIPFDELKIDRSFVHTAAQTPSLQAIVRASLCMARHLGLHTTAEGVECETDWYFLREACCDLAQGYFIARPMPAEQVMPWLTEWQEHRTPLTAPGAPPATGLPEDCRGCDTYFAKSDTGNDHSAGFTETPSFDGKSR